MSGDRGGEVGDSVAQASAERMLTATQEIVKHTKKTAELLKDGAGGGTMTFQ